MPRMRKTAATNRKKAAKKSTRAKGERKAKPASRKSAKTKAPKSKRTSKPAAFAGANRAEGIRLFALAGRPSKEDFQLVYGERGHLMTWAQRAEGGVPAEKFQAVLRAKQKEQ